MPAVFACNGLVSCSDTCAILNFFEDVVCAMLLRSGAPRIKKMQSMESQIDLYSLFSIFLVEGVVVGNDMGHCIVDGSSSAGCVSGLSMSCDIVGSSGC